MDSLTFTHFQTGKVRLTEDGSGLKMCSLLTVSCADRTEAGRAFMRDGTGQDNLGACVHVFRSVDCPF